MTESPHDAACEPVGRCTEISRTAMAQEANDAYLPVIVR
jgi:hypothetical protein